MQRFYAVLVLMLAVTLQHFALQQSLVLVTLALLVVALNLYLFAVYLLR